LAKGRESGDKVASKRAQTLFEQVMGEPGAAETHDLEPKVLARYTSDLAGTVPYLPQPRSRSCPSCSSRSRTTLASFASLASEPFQLPLIDVRPLIA
jgi:hypothetical protein